MARIAALSGFPEWLPEQELLERRVVRHLEHTFELHGYQPLTTRAVEPLEVLTSKGGDTDKEIYVLRRLHADPDEGDAGLGLHFDLTVPFARYVAERRGDLVFPWKRYQVQKVWRGERPQHGRYREFTQCDIDVIGQDELSPRFDAEVVRLLSDVLAGLPIPPVTLLVNHRKLLEGLYRGLGVDRVTDVLRAVDKRNKIGDAGVRPLLAAAGVPAEAADRILAAAAIEAHTASELEASVRNLGVSHPLLDQGLAELAALLDRCADRPGVRAALHIARGLDYYTGTVVEGYLQGHEHIGAVCSGGRYEDLAGTLGGGGKLPGVGVSIGLTRILGHLFATGALKPARRSPCQVLVTLPSEARRAEAEAVADALRARGIATDLFHRDAGWGKQLKRGDQLGIPYAWFLPDGDAPHRVKHLASGAQVDADPRTWTPDPFEGALPVEVDGVIRRWG